MASSVTLEDQARLLEDALVAVRQQTALMRKCLDTPGKLMDALKCWYVAWACVSIWSYTTSLGGPCVHPEPSLCKTLG